MAAKLADEGAIIRSFKWLVVIFVLGLVMNIPVLAPVMQPPWGPVIFVLLFLPFAFLNIRLFVLLSEHAIINRETISGSHRAWIYGFIFFQAVAYGFYIRRNVRRRGQMNKPLRHG